MRSFIIILFILGVFGAGSYWYTCRDRGLCDKKEETVSQEKPKQVEEIKEVSSFYISELGKGKVYSFIGTPIITKGSEKIDWSNGLTTINDSIFEYLNENQDKRVVLTGYYQPKLIHENGDSDSVLTDKRMNLYKETLVSNGINKERIHIDLTALDELYTSGNTTNKLAIVFDAIPQEEQVKIDELIAHKVLYSAFGSKEFKVDNTLRAYASELKQYLTKYPEKTVKIVGHTDNKGDAGFNKSLGLKRAENVKKYFIERGISTVKLKAESKGENAPIASNDSEEGRQLNRRIEVIVE